MPSKHSRAFVQNTLLDSFELNLVVRSLLGPSFKLCQPLVTKDAEWTIFNFTMERCKPTVGLRIAKNKRIMPAEKTGELLSHFPSKIRFVF